MKKLIIVCLILISTSLFAQEQTLLGKYNDIHHGGFGAPVIKFTKINGEFGVLTGVRGGWLIDHTVSLGFGGYGLATNSLLDAGFQDKNTYLSFGYGGFELEYVFAHDELLHLSFVGLIGGGWVDYRFHKYGVHIEDDHDNDPDYFFVAEPTINAELNVTSFFRINAGVGYRFVEGSDVKYTSDSSLSGVSGVLQLKFGSF